MPSANKADYDRAREAQASRDRGQSKGTAGMRAGAPQRPDVVKVGSGKDTQYMDTRTGQRYNEPSYGALSFKGLTSNDPANVARNRYGAQNNMRNDSDRGSPDNRTGIASLSPDPIPTEPEVPKLTPAELAMLGAPTTPMAPIFVQPPMYTPYDMFSQLGPVGGYGSAFTGMDTGYPSFDLMDIFAQYPNLGIR